MTISTTANRTSAAGNGSTTDFSFPYLFLSDDDLKVILVTDSTGAEVTQTITTHYTVTGAGVAAGGTVSMVTAPASGETLVIIREEQFTQGLDLVENDPLPSDSLEDSLDILTMLSQQLNTDLSRALVLPDGDTSGASMTLATEVDRKGNLLGFDSTDGSVEMVAVSGFGTLPAPTSLTALSFIRVNSGKTAYEEITPANVAAALDDEDWTTTGTWNMTGVTAVTFKDSTLSIQDDADATKKLAFQLSGITTGNTRTLSIPDSDGTVQLTNLAQTISGDRTYTGNVNLSGATIVSTIDGRDIAADGTKLDGIEAGATADQTGAEIASAIAGENLTLTGTLDISGGTLTLADSQISATKLDWTGTDLAVADGGTGASDAATALTNLGGIGAATTDTLTNKTIDANGTGNNLSNIDIGNAIAASQAEAEAGTNNTKLLTPLRVKQAIDALAPAAAGSPITVEFESGTNAITTDSTHTIAHGLGVRPTIVEVWIKCNSAERGWSVGDYLRVGGGNNGSIDADFAIQVDATNVELILGSALRMKDQSTKNDISLNVSKWDFVVVAYGGSLG